MKNSFQHDEEAENLLATHPNNTPRPVEKKQPAKKYSLRWIDSIVIVIITLAAAAAILLIAYDNSPHYAAKTEDFIRPITDQRQYENFVLSNGLKVLIISDPQATSSAVALSIQAGSFNNPASMAGLAHFVEHLVFLGSEKYPDLDGFSKYVSNHGGSYNAYTASEETNFYFQISPSGFQESLDMFLHMFVDPIFSKEWALSEVSAVDGEYNINLQKDSWRVQASLELAANPKSPFSKFSIGNTNTLITKPERDGIDVVKALQNFFDTYYSSNIMSLVVLHNDNLDTLQNSVKKHFSFVENKDPEMPFYGQFPPPFANEYAQNLIQLLPVGTDRTAYLVFCVDGALPYSKNNPIDYIYALLNYGGPGGLSSIFKKRGWALDFAAGSYSRQTFFELAQIQLSLTEEGVENLSEIVRMVLAYVKLIGNQGLTQDLFDQFAKTTKYIFDYDQYQDESYDNMNEVSEIASNMQSYPIDYVLSGNEVLYKFNSDLTSRFLNQFTADNLVIVVADPTFEVSESQEFNIFVQKTSSLLKKRQDQETTTPAPQTDTTAQTSPDSSTATPTDTDASQADAVSQTSSDSNPTTSTETGTDTSQADAASQSNSGTETTTTTDTETDTPQTDTTSQASPDSNTATTTDTEVDTLQANVGSLSDSDLNAALAAEIETDTTDAEEATTDESSLEYTSLNRYNAVYNLNYSINAFSRGFLESLSTISHTNYSDFKLPIANQYIPANFAIVDSNCTGSRCINLLASDRTNTVKETLKNDNTIVRHLLERSFGVPFTTCYIRLNSEDLQTDVKYIAASGIVGELVNLILTDELYEIRSAGHAVNFDSRYIKIETFSEKFSKVLETVLKQYKQTNYNQTLFQSAQEKYVTSLSQDLLNRPYLLANDILKEFLLSRNYTILDVHDTANAFKLQDFNTVLQDLQKSAQIETFLYGNVAEEQSKTLGNQIVTLLGYQAYDESKLVQEKVLNIQGKNLVYRLQTPVLKGSLSATLNYYQAGKATVEDVAYLKVLVQVLEQEAFTYLRTKKQLGYIASLTDDMTQNVIGLKVIVVSSSFNSNEVDLEIENFWKTAETVLKALTDATLSETINSYKDGLVYDSKSYRIKGNYLYSRISNQDYMFDLREKIIEYLPSVTKEKLLSRFEAIVKSANKFSIQLYSKESASIGDTLIAASSEYSNTEPTLIKKQDELSSFPKYE